MSRRWWLAVAAAFVLGAAGGWFVAGPTKASAPAAGSTLPPALQQAHARSLAVLDATLPQARNSAVSAPYPPAPVWQAEQLPPADAPDRAEALRALAEEGNAYAAFELAELLDVCQFHVPDATQAEIDQRAAGRAVLQADLQRAYVESVEASLGTDLPEPAVDEVELAEAIVAQELERQHACAGIDPVAARRDAVDWFERAAVLGHPDAQLTYFERVLQRGWSHPAERMRRKALARELLSAALARGDARALRVWSNVHRMGLFDEPDLLLAHAFLTAASREAGWLERAAMSALGNRLHGELSPARRRIAEALGREIHARCCAGSKR